MSATRLTLLSWAALVGLVLLLLTFSCQDREALAELEAMKAQAEVEEQNKELVKRTIEAWERGDFEAFKELLAPDFVFYYPSGSTTPMSQEETIEIGKMLQKAFPDISFDIEELIAVGDRVIFRFIQRGTHKGEYMGIPATGNKIESSGILIARIVNGKVAEQKEEFDMLGFMQQLGMELKPKEAEKQFLFHKFFLQGGVPCLQKRIKRFSGGGLTHGTRPGTRNLMSSLTPMQSCTIQCRHLRKSAVWKI